MLGNHLRARVLDVLHVIADRERQRSYQASVPDVDVPAELFNQWDEAYFPDDPEFVNAFARDELEALRRFDAVVSKVSDETPKHLPPLNEFLESEASSRLAAAAAVALNQLRTG
jgi:hypothetical protein